MTAVVIRLYARLQNPGNSSTFNCYWVEIDGSNCYLAKNVAGSATTLQTFGVTFASGDSAGLEVIGNQIKVYRKPSGGSWGQIGTTTTDSSVTGAGYIGVQFFNDPTGRIDNFGGGESITYQFARPTSTITVNGWRTDAASSTLHPAIDETSFNDSDYIQSALSPASADICEVKFGSLIDPATSNNHIVRYRLKKDTSGGDQITVVVRLVQGTTVLRT